MNESRNNADKVVSLNRPRTRTSSGALARMPAAMHQMREKARTKLSGLLSGFFDKADDALFQMADQATNNQEQNAYFDSMRELRLRRKDTESAFFRAMDKAIVRILDPAANHKATTPESDADGLSLVDMDDLEEVVASEAMVNRANEQFAEKIQHLSLRIDQLVPVKVYQKNNPVGPEVICDAFFEASAKIELGVKARLVLYKLFDRKVMQELGEVYDQLNQLFIDAKILPSLQTAGVKKNPLPPRSPAGTSGSSSERVSLQVPAQGAEQLLGTLRSLLNPKAGDAQQQASSGDSLGSDDLASLLTLAQHQPKVRSPEGVASPADVKTLVTELLQQSGNAQRGINKVDEDVINLVSMMFEFILEDRNLAPSMKVLLSRLQIPMIKVAITDKTFFGKGGHPARRLLNEMATASLGWQELEDSKREKDALYKTIAQTVDRILADYGKDIEVFNTLLVEFRSFLERDKRRAKILEQRTIDAEDGKAKSQRARAEVDAALEEIAAGKVIPQAAAALLTAAWANVMFITCLKEGPEGENFVDQLKTAKQLVWSVTVKMNADNRQKLLKLVPFLLSKLRKGLEGIAFNPYQMGKMFKDLEQLHLQVLRGKVPTTPAPADTGDTQAVSAATEDTVNKGAQPSIAERVHQEAAITPLAVEVVERSVAPAPETNAGLSHGDGQNIQETLDSQTLALVSNLSQGAWFEMFAQTGESYRCRLAAIIKPTGKYIFVNRTGMKVAEESKEQLALALRDGKIRLLDDGMLFDRALESVIGSLRKSRGAS